MMIVMGLDVSKHAGWAVWNSERAIASIKCDVLEFPAKASIEYCADQMGLKISALIKEHKPDFIVLETALKMSPGGSAVSIVSSCMLHGAVYATLGNWGKPWGTISVGTWRRMFFGQGFIAPQIPVMGKGGVQEVDQKTGKLKFKSDWKRAAIEQCEREGIELPSKKTIRDNAAEAAALAVCWRGAEIHAGRYIPAFQGFLQARNEKRAAA